MSLPSLASLSPTASDIPSLVHHINQVASFLARRDFRSVEEAPVADALILLGSEIYGTAHIAAEFYRLKKVSRILIVGGIGHSTSRLYDQIQQNTVYASRIPTTNRSEADILHDILVMDNGIPSDALYVENESTNCGQNAEYAYRKLHTLLGEQESFSSSSSSLSATTTTNHAATNGPRRTVDWVSRCIDGPSKIILIQDPTMQRRSHASFEKWWQSKPSTVQFFSYAPFIPEVQWNTLTGTIELTKPFASSFSQEPIPGVWTIDRFYNLLAGEIPRLRNTSTGYGPKGKNFIVAVDLPNEIELSFQNFLNGIPEASR